MGLSDQGVPECEGSHPESSVPKSILTTLCVGRRVGGDPPRLLYWTFPRPQRHSPFDLPRLIPENTSLKGLNGRFESQPPLGWMCLAGRWTNTFSYTTPFPLDAGASHVTLIFDGDCVCCLWSCSTGREPVCAWVRVPAVCLVCRAQERDLRFGHLFLFGRGGGPYALLSDKSVIAPHEIVACHWPVSPRLALRY